MTTTSFQLLQVIVELAEVLAANHCRIDINLDATSVEAYRKRLGALTAVVKDEVFKCGGIYVGLVADRGLEAVLKDDFLPAGLVEVN